MRFVCCPMGASLAEVLLMERLAQHAHRFDERRGRYLLKAGKSLNSHDGVSAHCSVQGSIDKTKVRGGRRENKGMVLSIQDEGAILA